MSERQGEDDHNPNGSSKSILLGGVETRLEGDGDDHYFRNIQAHAIDLGGLVAFVRRHVDPSWTVVDVGANIGLSAILLARTARHVVAYEPSPTNLPFLHRNLALNGITNVTVRPVAVSHEPQSLPFHVSAFGAGSHVVAAGHVAGPTMPTVPVPAVTLDDESHGPVSFIKIDAEGHEPEVLAGARRLLSRDRPLIHLEVNLWCLSAFAGHSPGTLVRALWDRFEVGLADEAGGTSPLTDPYGFLYDLIVNRKGYADIILRPRAGMAMASLPELTWPAAALAAVARAGGG